MGRLPVGGSSSSAYSDIKFICPEEGKLWWKKWYSDDILSERAQVKFQFRFAVNLF